MRDLLRRFASVPLALAAYNAGAGAVAACGCVPAYPETRGYVARILGLMRGAGDTTGLDAAGGAAGASLAAAGGLDPRCHLARHELDLPPFVSQRPEVDALASRRRVADRSPAQCSAGPMHSCRRQLLGIAFQKRSEDLAEDAVALGAILGHPGPHGRERVGKAAPHRGRWLASSPSSARVADAKRSGVVLYAEASQPSPKRATRRSPAFEPQLPIHSGMPASRARGRGELDIGQRVVAACVCGRALSANEGAQRS